MAGVLAFLLSFAAPAFAGKAAPPLKVLTFNVGGIPVRHPHWAERREALIAKLKASDYDVVALQEVWLDSDAALIAQGSGFPHSYRHNTGKAVGDGMLLLSRHRIVETGYRPFTCWPPSPLKFHQGEYHANKGSVLARVETPHGEIDVYNTHLVADYRTDPYRDIRHAQAFELYEHVLSRSAGRPFILLGDLNAGPQDSEYNLLFDLLDLQDVCLKRGYDHCGSSNEEEGKRIDHVLVPAARRQPDVPARLAFTENVPGRSFRYSDHLGVEAELDRRVLTRRLRAEDPRLIPLLAELRDRLTAFTESLSERSRRRAWIPVWGIIHKEFYSTAVARLESVRNRIDGRLLALKACPR